MSVLQQVHEGGSRGDPQWYNQASQGWWGKGWFSNGHRSATGVSKGWWRCLWVTVDDLWHQECHLAICGPWAKWSMCDRYDVTWERAVIPWQDQRQSLVKTEVELWTILSGIMSNKEYLYGEKFEVVIDQKPLTKQHVQYNELACIGEGGQAWGEA